jgi:hypothetical protein
MWEKGGYLFDGGGGEPLWLWWRGRRAMAAEVVRYITINFLFHPISYDDNN